MALKVTVWHEYRHETHKPEVVARALSQRECTRRSLQFLRKSGDLEVSTATLDEPEAGLTEEKAEGAPMC